MHPLNGKIFLNEKTSSLIWTKGAEMHTQFQAFSKKFLRNIYPLTYLELQSQMTPYFTEKMRKYFLSACRIVYFHLPKMSLHLFGIERSKRTLFFRKKAKKFARQHRRALKIPIGALPMGKNIYGLILKR